MHDSIETAGKEICTTATKTLKVYFPILHLLLLLPSIKRQSQEMNFAAIFDIKQIPVHFQTFQQTRFLCVSTQCAIMHKCSILKLNKPYEYHNGIPRSDTTDRQQIQVLFYLYRPYLCFVIYCAQKLM